jgi:nitroreductase
MKKNNLLKKGCAVLAVSIFLGLIVTPVFATSTNYYSLPPPKAVDMILEESIFRRCSIREFSDDPVSDEDLSTILWAAYGYRDDGTRTVPLTDTVHGAGIYVLRKNESNKLDVFRYDPLNHSLLFYKKISSFMFGQYRAPVYIGIVWDTDKSKSENEVGAEIGEIGQNIAFTANALDLGSVINVDILPWSYLSRIKLPSNEIPRILIPLGHPKYPYDFRYRPWDFSFLPRIEYSDMSLTAAIEKRNPSHSFEGKLTVHEKIQMIWSSYGFSYFLDRTESDFFYHISRHRTVPSAHGYYPLRIYACTESGIYRYHPNILLRLTFYPDVDFYGLPIFALMQRIVKGDYREELAQACSQPSIASAPLIILSVLDLEETRPKGGDDFSGEDFRWLWYYEAGASGYNVLLEATAWGLSANMYSVADKKSVCSILNLDETIFIPMYMIPVGR